MTETQSLRRCIECGEPARPRAGRTGPHPKRCEPCDHRVRSARSSAITSRRRKNPDEAERARSREVARRWRAANRDRARELDRTRKREKWANDPEWRERQIDYRRASRYGMRLGQYDEMLEAQGEGCAICGTPPDGTSLRIDHDHDCCSEKSKSCGECVRGLLCDACNRGIGMFDDDPERLRAAIDYLEGPKRTRTP